MCDVLLSFTEQAVFKGWSSFKDSLGSRRGSSGGREASSEYSATDDELGVERSGGSTPTSGVCWKCIAQLPPLHCHGHLA